MMRIPLVALLASVALAAGAATTVATVNMELVILSHPLSASNRSELQEMQARSIAQRDAKLEVRAQLVERYRQAIAKVAEMARNPVYGDAARAQAEDAAREAERAARTASDEVDALVADLQRKLRTRELELFGNVMADIRVKLEAMVRERGVDVVLDKSAMRTGAPIPFVLWSSDAIDLTDALIEAIGGNRAEAEAALERADEFLYGGGSDTPAVPAPAAPAPAAPAQQ